MILFHSRVAEAWQLSNPSILNLASLLGSLEIFDQVGMEKIVNKSQQLTQFLIQNLKDHFKEWIWIINSRKSR